MSFTAEHLAANRAGRLHPDQQKAGSSLGRSDVRFGTVMLVIGVLLVDAALALQFFPRALKDADFTFHFPEKLGVALFVGMFLGGILGGLPLVLGGAALAHGRRVMKAHEPGTCAVVEGPLQLLERRRKGVSSYFFIVGNQQLRADRKLWESMRGGTRVRAYYVPGVFNVLSVETV